MGAQGVNATINLIESNEELAKGNTELSNCKFNKAARGVSDIAMDILSMGIDSKVAKTAAQRTLEGKNVGYTETVKGSSFLKLKKTKVEPPAKTIGKDLKLTRRNTKPIQYEFPSADRMGENKFGFKSQEEVRVKGFEDQVQKDSKLQDIMRAFDRGKLDPKELDLDTDHLIADYLDARKALRL